MCVNACVSTSVYFSKCGCTLNGLTCVCPHCHNNVSVPIDINAVHVGFFFDFMSFFSPFIFCVCEDATVTHKVSIVKKEKEKKKATSLGLFAI